ncbi:MAG: hypothetical protein IKU37_03785 [Candidatus Gastranaerophilales bacterium]|nr:hypothetical protein [Candidatus Gastranaerophilales bacterium]
MISRISFGSTYRVMYKDNMQESMSNLSYHACEKFWPQGNPENPKPVLEGEVNQGWDVTIADEVDVTFEDYCTANGIKYTKINK